MSCVTPDITGTRFGRLIAIRRAHANRSAVYWECRCDCGKVRTIRLQSLSRGQSKSCGCLRQEVQSKRKRGVSRLGRNVERSLTGAVKTHAMRSREEAIADTFRDPLRLLDAWRKRIAA